MEEALQLRTFFSGGIHVTFIYFCKLEGYFFFCFVCVSACVFEIAGVSLDFEKIC